MSAADVRAALDETEHNFFAYQVNKWIDEILLPPLPVVSLTAADAADDIMATFFERDP